MIDPQTEVYEGMVIGDPFPRQRSGRKCDKRQAAYQYARIRNR